MDLSSVVTEAKVDFAELYTFAGRAKIAYASEAEIHSKYPATIRVSAPGGSDVQYFLEQDDRRRTQYITVRGTVDKKNFSEDLSIGIRDDREIDTPVHAGFDGVAEAVYLDLKPHLKPGYTRAYLTGHSLGGAIAALLALYIMEDGHSVERVVTFGQPQFTNSCRCQAAWLPAAHAGG
jgi:predicted lipase